MDNFFKGNTCVRCGKQGAFTMSRFNTDKICLECDAEERKHPLYSKAVEAELAAIKSGNRNFEGIGLPNDLKRK
jgi:hypothetical protein